MPAERPGQDDVVTELIRQYRLRAPTLSGRERARLEQELWVSAQPQEMYREQWLAQNLGESQRTYRWRHTLLRATWEADALWRHVDAGDMSLEDACALLQEVRGLSPANAKDFDAAMQLVLEKFAARATAAPVRSMSGPVMPAPAAAPVSAQAPDRGGGKRPPSVEQARRGGHARAAQRRARMAQAAAASVNATGEADFNKMMRSAALHALDQYLKSLPDQGRLDEYLVKRVREDFVAWVESGVESFFRDVRRLQTDARRDQLTRIGRTRFADACDVLALSTQLEKDGVRFGQPLSAKQAKKLRELVRTRHHARSRELHPDRHGNGVSEQLKAEYNAVQEARAVLEEYVREMENGHG